MDQQHCSEGLCTLTHKGFMLLKLCFLIMKLNTVKFNIQDKVVVYREQLKEEEKQFKCQFPLKTTVSMTLCD